MQFVQNIINDFREFSTILKIRLLASFLQRMITEGLIPFVTLFLVIQKGEFITGIIALSILILGIFFNGYGGKKVQKNNIKETLIIGEFLQFLTVFLMAFFVNDWLFLFIILYLLKSLLFSYLMPFGEVLIFEFTTNDNRASAYQFNGLMNSLAMPIGVFIGGILYAYGLDKLIYVLSGFSFLLFLLYFLAFSKVGMINTDTQSPKEKPKINFFDIFNNKFATLLILSSVLIHVLFFSLSQFLPAYLSNIENGSDILSLSRTTNGMVGIFVGVLLLGVIKKICNLTVMMITTIIYVFLFVLMFVLIDYLFIFYVVSGLVMVFYFMSAIGIKTIYANAINDGQAGIYLSAFSLTGRFGNIGAAIILTLSGIIGYSSILVLFVLLGAGAILCIYGAKHITKAP